LYELDHDRLHFSISETSDVGLTSSAWTTLLFHKADRNRGTVTGGDKGWLELEFAQIGSWLAGGGVVASNRREMA